MKKYSSVVLVATMLVLLLSACGAKSTNEGTPNATGKTEIKFWYLFGGNEGKAMEGMIKQYNESQDKVKVIGEYVPFGDMKQKLSIGLVGNDLPDIATVDNPDHAAFSAAGIFEDITARVNEWGEGDNYLEGPLNSAKYDGKLFGLPYTSNTLALYYNKDMFQEAGITEAPKTWDELRQVAKTLTTKDRHGLGFSAVRTEEGTFDFLPWLQSTGANYDSLDTPEAIHAFTFLTDLIKDGSVSKEVLNLTNGDTQKQFAVGRLAMMINGPWNIASVKADNPDLNFGIATIPMDQQESSSLGGENIAIIKKTNTDAAWDFLKWLSEAEQMEQYLVQTGYFPPRKDVASSSDHWTSDEHLKGFLAQMESAQPRGPHPKWPEISSAIQEAFQKSFSLSVEPATAASEAAAKIKEITK